MPADPGTGAKTRRRPRVIHDPPRRPDAVTPADKPKPQADPEVIRRQRTLRAAGYGVAVDGVWGPLSQRAWDSYLRRSRPVVGESPTSKAASTARAAEARKLAQQAVARAQVQAAQAKLSAQANLARMKAARLNPQTKRALGAPETAFSERARLRRQEIEREQTQLALGYEQRRAAEFAGQARKKRPEVLTSKELLAITTDPLTGSFSYDDPSDVRLVQRWLKANLDPKVVVDGVFGKQTGEAFLRFYNRELAREERIATNAIVEGLYKPAGLKAGEEGFPILGITPKPGDLYRLLTDPETRDSFAVKMLWPKLIRLSRQPDKAMLAFKERELDKFGAKLFGAFAMPEFVANTGTNKGVDQDFMRVALNALVPTPQAKVANDTTFQQLIALYEANKPEQFQYRVRQILRKDEMQFRDAMAQRAKQDPSFWGKAINAINAPAEYAQQTYVATAHAVGNVAAAVGYASAGDNRAAQRVLGQSPEKEAQAWISQFEKNHPWLNLGFLIAVDPLNFLPGAAITAPFRVGGRLTAMTLLRVEKAGLILKASGGAARVPRVLGPTWRTAATISGETLVLPAATGRAVRDASLDLTNKATRLKDVSVAIAKGKVRIEMRHGFEDFTPKNPNTEWTNTTFDANFTAGLKRTRSQMEAEVQTFLRPMVDYLVSNRVSIWADDTRTTLSEVGGAILGRMAEGIRVNEVQKMALDEAHSVFFAHFEGASHLTGQARAAIGREAGEAAKIAYRDVIERAGAYIVGHGDPELTSILNDRVERSLDRLMNGVLPAVQGRVQALLDEANLAAKEAAKEQGKRPPASNGLPTEDELALAPYKRYIPLVRRGDGSYVIGEPGWDHGDLGKAAYEGTQGAAVIADGQIVKVNFSPNIGADREVLPDELEILAQFTEEHGDEALQAVRAKFAAEVKPFEPVELFDELGRWTGNAGELSKQLRALGLEAFDSTSRKLRIRNRHFNIPMEVGEAMRLMASEIAVQSRRIESYAARRAAAGRKPADVDALIDRETKRIEAAYVPDGTGKIIDNREWLPVPDLYGRHLAEVYGPALDGTHPWLGPEDVPEDIRELLSIAAPPKVGAGGAFEGEMEKLAWALSGRTPVHANDFKLDPALRGFGGKHDLPGMGKFLEALDEREAWLAVAHDAALPQALRSEWAFWQALSHARTRKMRAVYTGLQAWLEVWTTLTLPARPGFVVRNVIDNTAKMLVYGVRDPRYYFIGAENPGAGLRSIFEADFRAIRFMLSGAGRFQDNPAVKYWDKLVDTFWDHSSDVLSRIFGAHGIPMPEEFIQHAQITRIIDGHLTVPDAPLAVWSLDKWIKFREGIWELMAARPENFAKRALYRHTYYKAIRDGATEVQAAARGIEAIEHTLYDYSKISTLEDNLRFIFPFAQFWRRTATFWATQSVQKPWLLPDVVKFEETLREDAHGEWPEWMRRYVDVTDLIANNPAFAWLKPYVSDIDVLTDPLNLFSFAPFYRAFKQENPDLPPDKAGMRIVSDVIDALNDWGLSFNPAIRKPLEIAGVANFRAWQSIFPQNSLLEAFTREFMQEEFPNGINLEAMLEDEILDLIGSDFSVQERIADNFDLLVNKEMAAQRMRGEQPSRAKAEEKIRGWLYAQTAFGFFSGIYTRAMDPATFHLYELVEGMHDGAFRFDLLTKEEQQSYNLFKRRGLDPVAFDRYVEALPLIEAYYAIGDWAKSEQFKRDHPEVIPHVDPIWTGKSIYSENAIRSTQLIVQTDQAFRLYDLLDDIGVEGDLRKEAEAVLVDKHLRAFWDANNTAEVWRQKHLKGLYWEHLDRLNASYHAIPDKDFEAKQSFLDAHPLLAHHWAQNNTGSDDLKDILNAVNADLRSEYFRIVKESGWDAAHSFLKQFPFMFEFTKAADRVTPEGDWVSTGKPGSQHARDYLAAKAQLDYYFSLSKERRSAWLRGGSAGAKAVLAYFAKYGSGGKGRGQTQHAKDYLAAKSALDHYFSLSKEERSAWLHSASKQALVVLAYFKKYGKQGKYARNWSKFVVSANPEINSRLQFWKRYFMATPDQRPALIASQAANAGIFVWGPIGEKERDAKMAEYLRGALARGASKKAAMYLRVKPLLDFYFTLKDKDEKRVFLKANPDVEEYLDTFSKPKLSGDKKLDALIERYFKLEEGSEDRSAFLKAHPAVQRWFNKKATPAERAIYRSLDAYFRLEGEARKRYKALHPEIEAFFDRRREEELSERAVLNEFDVNDPRLRQHFADAELEVVGPGERMRAYLQMRRALTSNRDELEVRRERTPQ